MRNRHEKVGVATDIAKRCLNHAVITGTYQSYLLYEYLDQRREAMEWWAAHVETITKE